MDTYSVKEIADMLNTNYQSGSKMFSHMSILTKNVLENAENFSSINN